MADPYVLLMMLPPDDLTAPQQPMPRDLVFIIDTSGSMHGTSLDQAKRALTMALNGLKPGDRFNVIQFNSVTSALFGGNVPATTSNIDIARRYVAGTRGQRWNRNAPGAATGVVDTCH